MNTNQNAPFYVVSMGKFTLLFFSTLGMYGIYWFYLLFRSMEEKTARNLFPMGRAMFAIFFVVDLFQFVYQEEEKNAPDTLKHWRPRRLAWIFIGVGIYQLLMQLVMLELGLGAFWRVFFIMSSLMGQFYVLYQVQLALNRIAADPYGSKNAKVTLPNMFAVVFGLYFWLNIFHTAYLIHTGKIPSGEGQEPTPPPTIIQPSVPSPIGS